MAPIRHTEQVLTGLIDEAQERLFLVSFVAYKVRSVLDALKRAQDRGVKIQVLLERSTTHGGSVDTDSIKTMKEAVPEIEFLVWEESVGESPYTPKVHAKCAVADKRTAFITSANLTNAAMETNMELGVLLRGGEIQSNSLATWKRSESLGWSGDSSDDLNIWHIQCQKLRVPVV